MRCIECKKSNFNLFVLRELDAILNYITEDPVRTDRHLLAFDFFSCKTRIINDCGCVFKRSQIDQW